MRNDLTIGVVTPPIVKAGITPLSNLIDILLNFSNDISIIAGNEFNKEYISNKEVTVISIHYDYDLKGVAKFVQYIFLQ